MSIEQVKQAHDLILLMEECGRYRMHMEESIGINRLLKLSSFQPLTISQNEILSARTFDPLGKAMLEAGISFLKHKEVELMQEIQTMIQKGGAQ